MLYEVITEFGWFPLIAVLFLLTEWLQREKQHGLALEATHFPRVIRWSLYYVVSILIMYFGGDQQAFIYFQF